MKVTSTLHVLLFCVLPVAPMAAPQTTQDAPPLVQQFTMGAGTGYTVNPIIGHQTSADPGSWALYGTTQSGGTGQAGIFYKLTPPPAGSRQWTETRLYLFGSVAADSTPVRSLVFDSAGAVYGILANTRTSAVFEIYKLTPPPADQTLWRKTIVHRFSRKDQGAPVSLAIDTSGALYVTELNRHGTNGGSYGSVVKMTPPATGSAPWTVTVLHNFPVSGGEMPRVAPILDGSGVIYGATNTDASHTGRVTGHFYALTPPRSRDGSWTYSTLYEFLDPDRHGAFPQHLVKTSSGALFGVEGSDYSQTSIVFQLQPPQVQGNSWTRVNIQEFDLFLGYEVAGLATVDDAVYVAFDALVSGARSYGGGIVWRFVPPSGLYPDWAIIRVAFNARNNINLNGEVVRDPAGLLYSSTEDDYTDSDQYQTEHGTIFMVDPDPSRH